jgi:serine protease
MWPNPEISRPGHRERSAYKRFWVLSVAPMLACLTCGIGTSAAQPTVAQTNRIIVKFTDPVIAGMPVLGASELALLSNHANIPLIHLRPASGQNQILKLPQSMPLDEVRQIATLLTQLNLVSSAEADVRYRPNFVPNDTSYTNQWYLFEAAGGINAETAWDITTGSASTVIAVLDSGILPHTELNNRLLPGYDFISDPTAANDSDGRDDNPTDPGDATAANECEPNTPAENSSWHGTLVSGVIATNTNNNAGIAGIDHHAQILPVRVLGKCGGFASDIIDAIRWSAGLNDPALPGINPNPADIINMSFGAAVACSAAEQTAIDDAYIAGVLLVTSAGNDAADVAEYAPANCNNVISVAASSRQGAETFYTNFGERITLSAPGGNDTDATNGIYSTFNTGTTTPILDSYAYARGTSFSAPMVSGAAALIKAVNPQLSPLDIRLLLQTSARSFPAGTSDGFNDCNTTRCGAGILDIGLALGAADSNALGGSGNGTLRMGQAAACITEDDGSVELAVERIDGTGNISVRISTRGISATPGQDYVEFDDILSWADGDISSKTISIGVLPDTVIEGSDFFLVELTNKSANAIYGEPMDTVVTIISTNGNTPGYCLSATSDTREGSGAALWLMLLGLPLLAIRRTDKVHKP